MFHSIQHLHNLNMFWNSCFLTGYHNYEYLLPGYNNFNKNIHSSQFQSLCSTKSFSETLQYLPYFIYIGKLKVAFFISCNFMFLPNECPGLCQQLWVFLYIKYGKFWSVSLELFVEHKLWNWEEWVLFEQQRIPKKPFTTILFLHKF